MPVFGLGTWLMGGTKEPDPNNDDKRDITAIKQAIDAGISHIDTAENYAAGKAEELVGEATHSYDRAKLFLVSKVNNRHLRHDDLIAACKRSLKRMQTDYLDLYLIHSPNPEVPIKETMSAMDDLKKHGLIKEIGISNFTIERTEQAQASTNNKIVANQLHLNLKYREAERKGLVDYCQKHDMLFIAWRPIQKGMILTKNALLDELCEKYNATPAQIAINWLISQRNIVTLSKMADKKHLEENLSALTWVMEPTDIMKLDSGFPNQADISDAVPLI